MPPSNVITFIIGTIAILFAAYYVTYYVGKKASGQTGAGMRNRNIVVLDRYALSRDKSFCVVEVAGKVYIVGVTNNAVTLLDTLDAKEYEKSTDANRSKQTPWSHTAVGQYGNKLTKKVVAFIAEKMGKNTKDSNEAANSGKNPYSRDFADSLEQAGRRAEDASEGDD